MDNQEALLLAQKIIEIDLLRDEMREHYSHLVGDQAEELLKKDSESLWFKEWINFPPFLNGFVN
jgi:hypothetical protein